MWRPGASSRAAKPLRIAMARLNATSCTAIITLLRVWIRSRRMRKFVSTSTPTDSCSFLFPELEASRTLTSMPGTHDRRQFLQALATIASMAAIAGGEPASTASSASSVRWPKLTGSPVLDSLHPVIEHSRDVQTHFEKIGEVAGWMAYEELPMPDYQLPFDFNNSDDVIDFILTADCVDTAFTDFSTHVKFQVDYAGRHWSDSDALFACMKRAMDNGTPILDGKFLARITRPQLERLFDGNTDMPMLAQTLHVSPFLAC